MSGIISRPVDDKYNSSLREVTLIRPTWGVGLDPFDGGEDDPEPTIWILHLLDMDIVVAVALQQKKARNLRNNDALRIRDTFLEVFPPEGRDGS